MSFGGGKDQEEVELSHSSWCLCLQRSKSISYRSVPVLLGLTRRSQTKPLHEGQASRLRLPVLLEQFPPLRSDGSCRLQTTGARPAPAAERQRELVMEASCPGRAFPRLCVPQLLPQSLPWHCDTHHSCSLPDLSTPIPLLLGPPDSTHVLSPSGCNAFCSPRSPCPVPGVGDKPAPLP